MTLPPTSHQQVGCRQSAHSSSTNKLVTSTLLPSICLLLFHQQIGHKQSAHFSSTNKLVTGICDSLFGRNPCRQGMHTSGGGSWRSSLQYNPRRWAQLATINKTMSCVALSPCLRVVLLPYCPISLSPHRPVALSPSRLKYIQLRSLSLSLSLPLPLLKISLNAYSRDTFRYWP